MTVCENCEARVSDLETRFDSYEVNMRQLWGELRDAQKRFDTLQTPLWKRTLFRIDGWPGQCNLNADGPAWRPWRRWWTS